MRRAFCFPPPPPAPPAPLPVCAALRAAAAALQRVRAVPLHGRAARARARFLRSCADARTRRLTHSVSVRARACLSVHLTRQVRNRLLALEARYKHVPKARPTRNTHTRTRLPRAQRSRIIIPLSFCSLTRGRVQNTSGQGAPPGHRRLVGAVRLRAGHRENMGQRARHPSFAHFACAFPHLRRRALICACPFCVLIACVFFFCRAAQVQAPLP
jgi:hypothetical protein